MTDLPSFLMVGIGEAEFFDDNVKLGVFEVTDIPPRPRGQVTQILTCWPAERRAGHDQSEHEGGQQRNSQRGCESGPNGARDGSYWYESCTVVHRTHGLGQ